MKEFKNKIYELEGLAELADMRPGKFAELQPLIEKRLAAVCAEWERVKSAAPVCETEAADTCTPAPESASSSPRPQGPAFCLNDRFRFTRVVAGGDRNRFNRVMETIAAMDGFDEARDYLIDTCNLDPTDHDVADLLEIVQQYFE